jgi:hypothetical protein
MRVPVSLPIVQDEGTARSGPALIAAGLAILIAATWWPTAPVFIAMGLVALGATRAMIVRFRSANCLATLLAAHLVVYGSLYLLLVGAAWHKAAGAVERGWMLHHWLDLATSVALMGVAARCAVLAMRRPGRRAGNSQPR